MKVKGIKNRLNTRPEMKKIVKIGPAHTFANFGNFTTADSAAAQNLVWSNNGLDSGGNQWWVAPVQGDNENNVEGTKYNLRYFEISFGIQQSEATAATSAQDYLRVFVIRERQPLGAPPAWTGVMQANNFFSPINTKIWDVQFDKIYPVNTGVALAGPPIVNTLLKGVPKAFRFIIPMKRTMLLSANNAQFPLRYYVCVTNFFTNVLYSLYSSTIIGYYRDP